MVYHISSVALIAVMHYDHLFLSPLSMHCYFMMPVFRYRRVDKIVRFLFVSEHLTSIIDLI